MDKQWDSGLNGNPRSWIKTPTIFIFHQGLHDPSFFSPALKIDFWSHNLAMRLFFSPLFPELRVYSKKFTFVIIERKTDGANSRKNIQFEMSQIEYGAPQKKISLEWTQVICFQFIHPCNIKILSYTSSFLVFFPPLRALKKKSWRDRW